MNSQTWNMFRENAMETASLQPDPIEYLARFNGLNVEIDEELPDNITEVWYEKDYLLYREMEKSNPERLDKGDRYEQ